MNYVEFLLLVNINLRKEVGTKTLPLSMKVISISGFFINLLLLSCIIVIFGSSEIICSNSNDHY